MNTNLHLSDGGGAECGTEIVVLVTASSKEESEKIAQAVIESRLAACANILPPMRSIYTWEKKVTETTEILLIFKTKSHLFDDLAQVVKPLHSYQIPEIIALPIIKGSENYLRWITENTENTRNEL